MFGRKKEIRSILSPLIQSIHIMSRSKKSHKSYSNFFQYYRSFFLIYFMRHVNTMMRLGVDNYGSHALFSITFQQSFKVFMYKSVCPSSAVCPSFNSSKNSGIVMILTYINGGYWFP